MLTEKKVTGKICILCASDFHLEMILLPYIKKNINNSKFVIFTENNLENTIEVLLEKVNINEHYKNKIREINWVEKNNFAYLNKLIKNGEKINIIINGNINYINTINKKLKNILNENIKTIDCFHIDDPDIDIKKIKKEYKNILNVEKL